MASFSLRVGMTDSDHIVPVFDSSMPVHRATARATNIIRENEATIIHTNMSSFLCPIAVVGARSPQERVGVAFVHVVGESYCTGRHTYCSCFTFRTATLSVYVARSLRIGFICRIRNTLGLGSFST